MDCNECKVAESGFNGTYNSKCVKCCARAIKSARPSKMHQENMIDALLRFPESPTREKMLSQLKSMV